MTYLMCRVCLLSTVVLAALVSRPTAPPCGRNPIQNLFVTIELSERDRRSTCVVYEPLIQKSLEWVQKICHTHHLSIPLKMRGKH